MVLMGVQPPCRLARLSTGMPSPEEHAALTMNPKRPRIGPPRRDAAPGSPRRIASIAAFLLLTVVALPPASSRAQGIKPWVPPAADSLLRWSVEAKASFQSNKGDSIGGENFHAYDLVGRMGRRLLRSLGRENLRQASAVEAVIDSLGLDTDVVVDPDLPYFAFLMVRNPYKRTAKAVGFLYWYRENDLRMQGAQFQGGSKPQMRVWWTGSQDAPYSWGVLDRERTANATLHLTLFRLHPKGLFWNLAQVEDTGIHLGEAGSAEWVDVNGDQRLEFAMWVPAAVDSMFDECASCPKRIDELTFVERPEGFRLLDTRLLPTPYSSFTAFVHLLIDNNRAQAARLVKDPGLVSRAVTAGWGARRAWRTWVVEEAEPSSPWPSWLIVRFRGPAGEKRYRINFETNRGRWVIRDWAELTARPARGAPAPGGRTR
jgi:hypothetical protein